jgi:hypothetical protein
VTGRNRAACEASCARVTTDLEISRVCHSHAVRRYHQARASSVGDYDRVLRLLVPTTWLPKLMLVGETLATGVDVDVPTLSSGRDAISISSRPWSPDGSRHTVGETLLAIDIRADKLLMMTQASCGSWIGRTPAEEWPGSIYLHGRERCAARRARS